MLLVCYFFFQAPHASRIPCETFSAADGFRLWWNRCMTNALCSVEPRCYNAATWWECVPLFTRNRCLVRRSSFRDETKKIDQNSDSRNFGTLTCPRGRAFSVARAAFVRPALGIIQKLHGNSQNKLNFIFLLRTKANSLPLVFHEWH